MGRERGFTGFEDFSFERKAAWKSDILSEAAFPIVGCLSRRADRDPGPAAGGCPLSQCTGGSV